MTPVGLDDSAPPRGPPVATLFGDLGPARLFDFEPVPVTPACASRGLTIDPAPDDRFLEVFRRAHDPTSALELRDLFIGRVEHEVGTAAAGRAYAELWRESRVRREVDPGDVLAGPGCAPFIKELFNFYFRDDLYGALRPQIGVILSSGALDEEAWGLPETLKAAIRYALARDWYGYSDSRGRVPARDAVAAYETRRIAGKTYCADEVALTLGATSAVSLLADFILTGRPSGSTLCAIPNYPPLVQAFARRGAVELVPTPCAEGSTDISDLIARLTPSTPAILLQTVTNPTGSVVPEADLATLIRAAAPNTLIVLDECHECLGPPQARCPERGARNVIRISSLSKTWSAPGLKVGWILADAGFIAEYYEHASTAIGGPPSFFYTLVEVVARFERWALEGVEAPTPAHLREFEAGYGLDLDRIRHVYAVFGEERAARETGLLRLRDAAMSSLSAQGLEHATPRYSINAALRFADHADGYVAFRTLLRATGVSIFPGVLNFCLAGAVGRITTARRGRDLNAALGRLARATSAGARR
jgi:aspartate/methionine/tyrosine aminotransferase